MNGLNKEDLLTTFGLEEIWYKRIRSENAVVATSFDNEFIPQNLDIRIFLVSILLLQVEAFPQKSYRL